MRAVYLFLIIFFVSIKSISSQNTREEKVAVLDLVQKIEQKDRIYFSYAANLLDSIFVFSPAKNISIDDLQELIKTQTHLILKKVSSNQYVITKDEFTLETEQLSTVVINSYITHGVDRNQDGSISIDKDKMGILPGLVSPDIAQSIQLIPGINTLDESATGIQIRGGTSDQNLILYDGIKLYNTGHFYGMFSLFNPFSTSSAKIFRSGTSVVYGDRISGVIDISSGNSIPKKIEGGLEIDGLSVNGFVKTKISPKLGVYLFARRSYTDYLRTTTYNSYADKIFTNSGSYSDSNGTILELETDDDITPNNSTHDFSFNDFSSKIIYQPNAKNTLSFSTLYTHNAMDFNFGSSEEKITDNLETENNGLSVHWDHTTNQNQKEEFLAYYSSYESFYQNDELKTENNDQGILEVTEINLRENEIHDLGFKFVSKTTLKENQKLNVGYELSNTQLKLNVSQTKPFDVSENSNTTENTHNLKNALFGEYNYIFGNKSILSLGLRMVHYNHLHTFQLEPRVNFEYSINKNFRIKSSAEIRNQPIAQLVEFNHTELRLENNLWRFSNDKEFPLLNSKQVSGGLLFNYKKLNIDLDTYYKKLDGLTTLTNGFSTPLQSLETGSSTIKGLDVLVKYKLPNYKFWLGYTYNDIQFYFPTLDQEQKKFSGNNDITHQLRISNTLRLKNWQLSLGWQFRSGQPVTPVNSYVLKKDADNENAGVVNFGNTNSSRLPNFHRLDASLLYNIYNKEEKLTTQLGFSVLNIYNRVIPLNVVYKAEVKPLDDGGIAKPGTDGASLEDREVILEQVIQRFSLGLTPNLSLKFFF